MVRHNNVLPNVHLRKHWQRIGVRTWFNQAGRKKRRLETRRARAAKMFPRPTSLLRPVVRSCTLKYNCRERRGKGFTLTELAGANLNCQFARSIGIAVDHRRNTDALQQNVQRLKRYIESLVIFPRREGKPRQGEVDDNTEENIEGLVGEQVTDKSVFAINKASLKVNAQVPTPAHKVGKAYQTMRMERMNKKWHDKRIKRAEDAKNAPKKGQKGKKKNRKK